MPDTVELDSEGPVKTAMVGGAAGAESCGTAGGGRAELTLRLGAGRGAPMALLRTSWGPWPTLLAFFTRARVRVPNSFASSRLWKFRPAMQRWEVKLGGGV